MPLELLDSEKKVVRQGRALAILRCASELAEAVEDSEKINYNPYYVKGTVDEKLAELEKAVANLKAYYANHS